MKLSTSSQRFAARFPRVVPAIYWQTRSARQQLVLWLCIGIVLRCVLMPFTAHTAYLDSHWRSEQIADRSVLYPARAQFLSYAADAAWLALIAPLLPERTALFAAPPAIDGRLDAMPNDYARFVADPQAKRALFLTKLIYLIVDMAAGLLLLHLFANHTNGLRAFKVWMLNPAVLYSVFIVGRADIYAIFCLVLSLIFLARQRPFGAALAFGFAIAFHSASLLLLPVYVLGLTKHRSHQLLVLTLAVLPQLLIMGVMEGVLRLQPAYDTTIGSGAFTVLMNTTVGASTLFPFIVGYMLVLLWLNQQTTSAETGAKASLTTHSRLRARFAQPTAVETLAKASLTVYLLMYVFTFHSAHDVIWLTPFAVPLLGLHRNLVKPAVFFVAAWALFWLIASDSSVFTGYLFSPLYGSVQIVMPYGEWLAQRTAAWQITLEQLVTAARSILGAVAVWFLFQLWRRPPLQRVRAR